MSSSSAATAIGVLGVMAKAALALEFGRDVEKRIKAQARDWYRRGDLPPMLGMTMAPFMRIVACKENTAPHLAAGDVLIIFDHYCPDPTDRDLIKCVQELPFSACKDGKLNLELAAPHLTFDIVRVTEVRQGVDGARLVQAEHMHACPAIEPHKDYPFRTDGSLVGKFSFTWQACVGDKQALVVSATDALLTTLLLPLSGERLVGLEFNPATTNSSGNGQQSYKGMPDPDGYIYFVIDLKKWPWHEWDSFILRRLAPADKAEALLQSGYILDVAKVKHELGRHMGMATTQRPSWMSTDHYAAIQHCDAIARPPMLARLLQLDFNMMQRDHFSIRHVLPPPHKYEPLERPTIILALCFLEKVLVCVFCTLFHNVTMELRESIDHGDLQWVPLVHIDYLIHLVLQLWGTKCGNRSAEGLSDFKGRPAGKGPELLAALIKEHFTAEKCRNVASEWPAILERARIAQQGAAANSEYSNAKRELEVDIEMHSGGDKKKDKKKNKTQDGANVDKVLCTQHALHVFKVTGAAACKFDNCRNEHPATLISGGKSAALDYVKKHATHKQKAKLTKVAGDYTGY